MSDIEIVRKSLWKAIYGAIDRHVKQRPRDSFKRNAIDDPAEPLVKRVTNNDACSFCNRFASDKPINPREASEKFHQFCKCHFMLFFQETKYKDKIVSEDKLHSIGVTMEDGAKPDDFEKRDAIILAALGRNVEFLKRNKSGSRRADSLIDGEVVEFKNPKGSGLFTVTYQIQSNLYGRNKTVINPQSDVLLISNVRNRMTMFEMERSLEFAFGRESILTDDEKAEIKKVILLDERTRRIRTYEMN